MPAFFGILQSQTILNQLHNVERQLQNLSKLRRKKNVIKLFSILHFVSFPFEYGWTAEGKISRLETCFEK